MNLFRYCTFEFRKTPVKNACHSFRFLNLVFFFFLFPFASSAQNPGIIPLPKTYTLSDGKFMLGNNAIIGMNNASLLPQANYLQTELQKSAGIAIAADQAEGKATIDLQLVKRDELPGSYILKIAPERITIASASNEGIFYGLVSLLQMVRTASSASVLQLQACEITDSPRFQWRGFMLDESRHFFGKEKVKQLLDWMAFYKLNKFHWHLTDVDGWRIEIKKYPKLTTVGGIGNKTDTLAEAKFYTQAEIKEIVDYAAARFITVIPEIDMPGHATAANKAYPEYSGGSIAKYPNFTFDPSNENTYQFLSDILKETNSLFPSGMIHLGGDEVALGMQAWAGRPSIMEMMAKNNFTSLADLEHYFFRRMTDSVLRMGDKILCWDEAAESDLPAGKTIVFWWRQNVPSQLKLALDKKYQVVLCPRLPFYFDFVEDKSHVSGRRWSGGTFNSVSSVYNFPYREFPRDELNSKLVLGIQANVWTELIGSPRRLDFMTFPRMAALAEAAWTDSARKDEASFNERLKANFPLYDKDNIYYYNPFDPGAHPEAIDFAPKPVFKAERYSRHSRIKKSKRHHSKEHTGKARSKKSHVKPARKKRKHG
ncbi:beta-N-acetylhexosaminidase [Mucilaginibacter sp. L3T2-6]|uniref:beta-N-acetylhexosaminidase n=1 Tax=Mucilaginibacter sp. L3T2-6 TaxID=3062491 RepID=UPI00267665D6|nr:beta-N-acetylhexosaminidase [Mucilaginibacter sp. L3T2-6]MDO3645157.1 beta-N-acetylhexosaminidase [Mucilaginibacter sp. L3T2-6]MDV6217643.1 beta-N-acetylhexosaminidase [Mucilaginibacter sp. L3T2-6]